MATHCHNPNCPAAPKIYKATKQVGMGAFMLTSGKGAKDLVRFDMAYGIQ